MWHQIIYGRWGNSSRVQYNEEALPDREGCQTLAQITKESWGISGHLNQRDSQANVL